MQASIADAACEEKGQRMAKLRRRPEVEPAEGTGRRGEEALLRLRFLRSAVGSSRRRLPGRRAATDGWVSARR
eukprot:2923150-Rhodomonas_salina.1